MIFCNWPSLLQLLNVGNIENFCVLLTITQRQSTGINADSHQESIRSSRIIY